MRNVIIRFALMLASITANQAIIAQPRVDGGTSAKVIKSSPVVSNFIGWAYDETAEKWCGYYNTIFGKFRNNNRTPRRMVPEDMAVFDNVVSLQVKKVIYGGDTYYLLLSAYYKGKYKYPTIEEDWYCKKVTNIYLLTEDEYAKLKDLKPGINTIYSASSISFGGGIGFGLYDDFSTAMMNLFKEKYKDKIPTYYRFYIKKENEKIYRFQSVTNIELDTSERPFATYRRPNFNVHYYEISASLFKQLLI